MESSYSTTPDSWTDVLEVESVCDRFERAYREGRHTTVPPRIEHFLGTLSGPRRSELLGRLLEIELDYRLQSHESPTLDAYLARFPLDGETVRAAFRELTEPPPAPLLPAGARLGRYTIRGLLGQGGMGAVYRAWDEQGEQEVALKVIRADRLAEAPAAIRHRWVDRFHREAQAASRLRHPAIVPVLDFGEAEGRPYLAMQLVEGRDLRALQAETRLSVPRAVGIVVAVADALDYLHQHDLYHCDVKPSNILVGRDGQPYLSDFGLALAEDQIPAEPGLAGTAAYMSPEQARGEGHLVDGRTDIFSLGTVLYELLAGERPFDHPDRQKTLERVCSARVVPLRQKHPELPAELDLICQRALSRHVDDRYPTARDLAHDLRAFLQEHRGAPPADQAADASLPRIDLKGIAAFGPAEARVYPLLLPGPRTRSGLPVSIANWLEAIVTTVPRRAFRVGLLYGPSGCGKSSLVRAGILPRLPDHVAPVLVDGSHAVEAELRQALSPAGRGTPLAGHGAPDPAPRPPDSSPAPHNHAAPGGSLPDLLAAIRRGNAGPAGESGKKLLIVIDHFEHWLQAHPQLADAELTAALRQCDGARIQCLLLFREEFRTSATRLLKELDLGSGGLCRESLVDLFDAEHACRVLTAMGRSSQSLPATDEALTDGQRRFLDGAVQLLQHDGRIVPAHLAMFVDYMRDKPWNAESLPALGGLDAVVAEFFDGLLQRAVGGGRSRRDWDTVAAILRTLLPASEAEYRRPVRSQQDLFAAVSGCRPDALRGLLASLCRQARILTPVDVHHVAAECRDAAPAFDHSAHGQPERSNAGVRETAPRESRYQLAHDSLLPLIRVWLQLKQQERWWGRHVQRMTEHAVTWSRRPTSAFLPAPADWGLQLVADAIGRLWPSSCSSSSVPGAPLRRPMMRAATRFYVSRLSLLALLAALTLTPLVWYADHRQRITQQTVAEILFADAERLPDLMWELAAASPAVQRRLDQELGAELPSDASELAKDDAAGRRGNAAVALCLAAPQHAGRVWPLLAATPDPRLRTALIHRLAAAGVEPQVLVDGYQQQRDPGVRQALLLTLGQYAADRLPPPLQDSFVAVLQADYRADPDAGVHAGIHWLLRRWGHGRELDELNRQLETAGWNQVNAWYHTPSGHLMIVFRGPVEFEMGAPDREYGRQPNETRHRVRIERAFAISAAEVTESQFRQGFGPADEPRDAKTPDSRYPKRDVLWNNAAWYCIQLTEREGLDDKGRQQAYLPDRHQDGTIVRNYYGKVKCVRAPQALQRTGYRLPTEEEWEYACRGGTETSRFFGETAAYMDSYAWSYDEATEAAWPVASLMPNAFGLFDVLGNVSEWCHDIYQQTNEGLSVSLRGGSAWSPPIRLRAAARYHYTVRSTAPRIGFRIARTLPPP